MGKVPPTSPTHILMCTHDSPHKYTRGNECVNLYWTLVADVTSEVIKISPVLTYVYYIMGSS
jgi:hypothetical protein